MGEECAPRITAGRHADFAMEFAALAGAFSRGHCGGIAVFLGSGRGRRFIAAQKERGANPNFCAPQNFGLFDMKPMLPAERALSASVPRYSIAPLREQAYAADLAARFAASAAQSPSRIRR